MNLTLLYNDPGPQAGPDDLDTLDQVREIRHTLEGLGHGTGELAVPEDLGLFRKLLREGRDRLFFNLTDPRSGEGRFIALPPLALEQEGCRYTGCGADALYLTSNKLLAKRMMASAGIPTPRWIAPGGDETDTDAAGTFVPGTYLVKSVWEHGSAGMTEDSVFRAGSAKEARARLSRESGEVFAEAFLPGREINIGLLVREEGTWELLPPSEILYTDPDSRNPFLDYRSKWDEESDAWRMSARTLEFSGKDEPLLAELRRIALDCARLFGLNGYARVDFRLDGEGRPMVMEVNANPCLTPGGGFAAAAERGGISYPEVIRRIIAVPVRRP